MSGLHVYKGKSFTKSILDARARFNLSAVQIFTHGPRGYNEIKMDVDGVRNAAMGTRLYVHSSYMSNPWKSPFHTVDQFKKAQLLGAKGVVLHIPKIDTRSIVKGVVRLARTLRQKNINVKIILEMKALKRHAYSLESAQKINTLIAELSKVISSEMCGICIDTAHIYAGQTDIKTFESANQFLQQMDPKWISLLHLNGNQYDSSVRAGDKHALPLSPADKIWSGSYETSGCRAFVEWGRTNMIPFILEVKKFDGVAEFLEKI